MRVRNAFSRAVLYGVAMLAPVAPVHAQQRAAASLTDPNDPAFLTEQTRKQGGPMPAEQMALVFDHLDQALKVFPSEKRIEGVTTLSFTTKAPIRTVILDLYPKYQIASISIDGKVVPPSRYSNPEGQLRILLATPFAAGRTFTVQVVYSGTPPLARRPPWEGGTTWTTTPDSTYPWIDTSLWGGGCDLLYPCLDHPTLKPATTDLHYTVPTGLMAPGNGVLVSRSEKDGWTTWNWHARSIHTYGSVLNVGPYKVLAGEYQSRFGNTIPMRLYYIPGEEQDAASCFSEFPQTLDFWENVIGPVSLGGPEDGRGARAVLRAGEPDADRTQRPRMRSRPSDGTGCSITSSHMSGSPTSSPTPTTTTSGCTRDSAPTRSHCSRSTSVASSITWRSCGRSETASGTNSRWWRGESARRRKCTPTRSARAVTSTPRAAGSRTRCGS
jgi:hypothetical protein